MPPVPRNGCDLEQRSLCQWVYERTGNQSTADVVDWFLARPVRVVLIVLLAWVGARLARRAIRRWVPRLYDHEPAADRLARFGIKVPDVMSVEVSDPRRKARGVTISSALTSTVTVVIWVIAGLMVLDLADIDIAPLLAGAGVAGVALGFGAQSIVRDVLAGLFMLIEDQ